MGWQAGETIALVVMAVFEGVTLIFYFREKAAKDKAEQDLKQIKRRGDAPYLVPSGTVFGQLYFAAGDGEIRAWHVTLGNVLSFQRNEVGSECPAGNPVILVVDNTGESARGIVVKLDGEEISLKREADLNDAHGLYFLEYPYAPEKRGQEQRIAVSFETQNGVQDTHRYITRHGFRVLQRINPALP
jgi:hypothetical protein